MSSNPKLTTLNAQTNDITSLDFSNNPLLNTIYCNDNALTVLDVRGLPLTVLWAQANPNLTTVCISSIPAVGNVQFRISSPAQWSLCNQAPVITFSNITKAYGDAAFTVATSSNSPGAFTYSIIAGNEFAEITPQGLVTIKGSGNVTIQVQQAGAGVYASASANALLTINKAVLTAKADDKVRVYNTSNPLFTISYAGFVYGETVAALASVPVASASATVTSDVSTYAISVTGGSSNNYTILPVQGTLTITKATPILSYTGLNVGTIGNILTLSSSSTSPGVISYVLENDTGSASLLGSVLTLVSEGIVYIEITQSASTNYFASSIIQTINIRPSVATITFQPNSKTFGDAPFFVSASSASSGAFTYSIVSGSQYATLTPQGLVTILGAGFVEIKAEQAAADGYGLNSKTSYLSIGRAFPEVSYTGPTRGYTGQVIELTGTTTSGGSIVFVVSNSSGSATISGKKLTLLTSGNIIVEARSVATTNYFQSSAVSGFVIQTASDLPANLTVTGVEKTYGDAPFTIQTSTSSSGALTYSILSGASFADVSSTGEMTIKGVGDVSVQVMQAAVGSYASVAQTADFKINKAVLTVTADPKTKIQNSANPNLSFTYSGFVYGENTAVLAAEPMIFTTAETTSPAGDYPIQLSGGSANNYDLVLIDGVLTITIATDLASSINKDNRAFYVYPNPVLDKLRLKLQNNAFEVYSITLFDAKGNVLFGEKSLPSNVEEYEIPMNELSSGLYTLVVHTSAGNFQTKVAK